MATLAVGGSTTLGLIGWETINIVTSHGTYGRIVFVPKNAESPPPVGSSRSFGPGAQNITFGPWGIPGSATIYCDSGSTLTYTNNTADPAAAFNSLSVYGATALNSINANVTISPTGTGTVTINPATLGNIDNTRIGFTLRNTGGFTYVAVSGTDTSGTPGNVTNNSGKGRVAIAAGASSVVVSNTACAATTTVIAVIAQATADATLTQIVRVAPAAGSFTIYGNANATANTVVDYFLVLN